MEWIKKLQVWLRRSSTQEVSRHTNTNNVNIDSSANLYCQRTQRDRNPKSSSHHLVHQRVIWVVILERVSGETRWSEQFRHQFNSARCVHC